MVKKETRTKPHKDTKFLVNSVTGKRIEVPQKANNLPAKHSVNKTGAGPHKSVKDYKRKTKDNNKLGE